MLKVSDTDYKLTEDQRKYKTIYASNGVNVLFKNVDFYGTKHLFTSLETAELKHVSNLSLVFAERGVCANRLRQERSEGAGHQAAGEPPLHHRAES